MKSPYSHRGLGQDLLKNYLLTQARLEGEIPNRRGWIWLGIGLLLGACIVIPIVLKSWHHTTTHNQALKVTKMAPVNLPKFEFYGELAGPNPEKYTPFTTTTLETEKNNLNNLENKIVAKQDNFQSHLDLNKPIPKIIPNHSSLENQKKQKQITDLAAQKNILHKMMTYFVQAGVFQDYQSADALKARLAFLGFRTQINQTTDKQDPNQRLYHVTIGPLESKQVALKVKSQLEQHHIQQVTLLSRL